MRNAIAAKKPVDKLGYQYAWRTYIGMQDTAQWYERPDYRQYNLNHIEAMKIQRLVRDEIQMSLWQ